MQHIKKPKVRNMNFQDREGSLNQSTSCMILLDHSEFMRCEDYDKTRFEFQQKAAYWIANHMMNTNTTKSKTIGVMCGTDIMVDPVDDPSKIYAALEADLAMSTPDLTTSLRVASLALEKSEQQNDTSLGKERKLIVLFVGSPVINEDLEGLAHEARILNDNDTNFVVVAIGNELNHEKLNDIVSINNGKLYVIPPRSSQDTIENEVEEERNDNCLNQIDIFDQWLYRIKKPFAHTKKNLVIKTSFSSEAEIPIPPTSKSNEYKSKDESERGAEINSKTNEADRNDLEVAVDDYKNALVKIEQQVSTSPGQENISRLGNLPAHVPIAEYERVKKELRAAKRYIRILQRLVHEKDEMISALHEMIGCLRSQVYGTSQSSSAKRPLQVVTSLTLDGMKEDEIPFDEMSHGDSNGADLLKSSSRDSQLSIETIRRKTRELEALHAKLTNRSQYLQQQQHSGSSLIEKRNKKRELEALRASIVSG